MDYSAGRLHKCESELFQRSEKFQDELMQLPANNISEEEEEEAKPFYRNVKFWIAICILLLGGIVGIAIATSSGDVATDQSQNVLPESPPGLSPTEPPTTSPETHIHQSNEPSNPPSESPLYDPPSAEECEAVSNGKTVMDHDRENQLRHSFEVYMDLALAANADHEAVVQELEEKIQTKLVPIIVGCYTATIRRNMRDLSYESKVKHHRQLALSPYSIAGAQAHIEKDHTTCTTKGYSNCIVVIVTLDLYLKGPENHEDLMDMVSSVFGSEEEAIIDILEMSNSLVGLVMQSVESKAEISSTSLPTMLPSTKPTFSPTIAASSTTPTVAHDVTPPTTDEPTKLPTSAPSMFPTKAPSSLPTTDEPTKLPTLFPTKLPSSTPTALPTITASLSPTFAPVTWPTTEEPTRLPTPTPTKVPSTVPSKVPSIEPSMVPSRVPTTVPTTTPTEVPTLQPTFSSSQPSDTPTSNPTSMPTVTPSKPPSLVPTIMTSTNPTMEALPWPTTAEPTEVPTAAPTKVPTVSPSSEPSDMPTSNPTSMPTVTPSTPPTPGPSVPPTTSPTVTPTLSPTPIPTLSPTLLPTFPPTQEPLPTLPPTVAPTASPTTTPPTPAPTMDPTLVPTIHPTPTPTPFPTIASSESPSTSSIPTFCLQPLERPIRVACAGDSLTKGTFGGQPWHTTYPFQLQQMLGANFEVGNYGVNSVTALRGLSVSYVNKGYFYASLNVEPDIYLLMLGHNDAKYGGVYSPKFRTDMEWIVNKVQSISSQRRIIVAIPPWVKTDAYGIQNDVLVSNVQPAIKTLAALKNLQLVDLYEVTYNQADSYLGDGLHLSKKGNGSLAAAWKAAIECNQNGICEAGENCITCPKDC